jgi:peptidoglycan/xylan/chitin deacetylase (PgdA/CDA1 family)
MNKILNFHHVNDGSWFENIVCFLKSKYKLIPYEMVDEFYHGHVDLKNVCHITVDVGDKAFYNVIFPVLRKHNVPASIFISPKICTEGVNFWFQEIAGYNQMELKQIIADIAGISIKHLTHYDSENILKSMRISQINDVIKRYRRLTNTSKKPFLNMSVAELREVFNSGLITIGAHTMNHPVLANEEDKTSKDEIIDSITELSNIFNQKVKCFSYPNGIPQLDFSEREQNYLITSGIKIAFSTESKNFLPGDDFTKVPRFGISDGEKWTFFITKMCIGSNWDIITRMKPNGEYKQRQYLTGHFKSDAQA